MLPPRGLAWLTSLLFANQQAVVLAQPHASALTFSGMIESSTRKAVTLFNNGCDDVHLVDFSVKGYHDGSVFKGDIKWRRWVLLALNVQNNQLYGHSPLGFIWLLIAQARLRRAGAVFYWYYKTHFD